ncbi:MAG: pentapeptide repeat-containing protein [Alphaproteobacteria bacterium]
MTLDRRASLAMTERVELYGNSIMTQNALNCTMSDDSPPGTHEDGPNPEHLAILRQGVGAWNKWRAENPDVRPNLVGFDLSGINFAGNAFILGISRLGGGDVLGGSVNGANLRLANLRKTKFKGSDLNGVDLQWANITRADLSESLHLTQQQIDVAYGNWLTLLPPGLIYPDRWEKEPVSNSGLKSRDDVRDWSEYFFKPFPEPEDRPSPKSSILDIPSPISMAWNAEGKIAVIAPQERPPAHGLGTGTRDLLAQALIAMATDLANHIRDGNSDQNIAKRLDAYARECAKGGAQLNILQLDAIVRTVSGLVRRDTDALSVIDSEEFSVFTHDHDALTRFYPDFEDYKRALASAPNISAPPSIDLAKLLRELPGSQVFDASVPDAIDDVLPQGGAPLAPKGLDTQETKERKFALIGIVKTIWKALTEIPVKIVNAYNAIDLLIVRLQPFFDWLMKL